jgi:proton-coupled amino acid transporter
MELQEHCNVIVNENFRRSTESFYNQFHPDVLKMKAVQVEENGLVKKEKDISKQSANSNNNNDEKQEPQTTYLETLMHLFKGNVGPGCFAMASAVKNGGLILAPILTLIIGVICVHVQHVLLNCSKKIKNRLNLLEYPDYAETVELVFSESNYEMCRKNASLMKTICNAFICITQLGFCCIYFLFITTNLKQILDFYGFDVNFYVLISLVLIPIWLSALITNLKYLAPCSLVANACMITGLVISYYYSSQDLPHISERNYFPPSIRTLPLFFGTAIFAFEGIALVLPLKNAMKQPKNFSMALGVLNIGMVLVSGIFISFGFMGYYKYGEDTAASLTLNLPINEM